MRHDRGLPAATSARDAAEFERDEAVRRVVAAFRARAHTWLTWVAFMIAKPAASRIDQATVEYIEDIVTVLADDAEHQELFLSYDSVNTDERGASLGDAAHVVDQATRKMVVDLGYRLRRLGLRPGPYFPNDLLVSRFWGDDGFHDLLADWARAETALRQAERRHQVAATLDDLGGLRKMWGQDDPCGGADSGPETEVLR
jgi:hypothetical protein